MPRGKIPKMDYIKNIASKGEIKIAIELAENHEIYGFASEIAIENGLLEEAVSNALNFLDDNIYHRDKRYNLPGRIIGYLEKKGVKNFPEWEKEKHKLKNWAVKLYSKEIEKVQANLRSLKKAYESELEKISKEK